MKKKTLISIFMLLLFCSSIVTARSHSHGMRSGERMMAMLELSDEQAEKIEAIHLKASKSTLPLMSKMKIKEAELDELMVAEKPNRNAIIKKIQELESLKSEFKILNTLKRLDVRDLLTEEQRIKFDHMRMSRGPGRPGMERHMGHTPGLQGRQSRKPGTSKFHPFNRIEEEIEIEKE